MEKFTQDFKAGRITRRQLLALAAALPVAAAKDEAPLQLKATWVNHYVYVAPDLMKTSDWYRSLRHADRSPDREGSPLVVQRCGRRYLHDHAPSASRGYASQDH